MIKKKLKHALLPGKHNDYRPLALRHKWLSLYTIGLLISHLTFGVAFYTGPATADDAKLTKNIIELTNATRASNSFSKVSENQLLTNAAYAKLSHMFQKNYWDHRAPDGTEAWYFIENSGYDFSSAGENLAKGFSDSDSVFTAWMKSPTHRANILDRRHENIGVAVGTGEIGGKNTTVIVQLFGTKMKETQVLAKQPETPAPKVEAPVAAAPAPEPAPEPKPETQVATKLEAPKQVALGTKTNIPTVSVKNATSKQKVPYLYILSIILGLLMIDFAMVKRLGVHRDRYHRFHFRSAVLLAVFTFLVLLVGIASIA